MSEAPYPQPAPVETRLVFWYFVVGLVYFAVALLAGFFSRCNF